MPIKKRDKINGDKSINQTSEQINKNSETKGNISSNESLKNENKVSKWFFSWLRENFKAWFNWEERPQ